MAEEKRRVIVGRCVSLAGSVVGLLEPQVGVAALAGTLLAGSQVVGGAGRRWLDVGCRIADSGRDTGGRAMA